MSPSDGLPSSAHPGAPAVLPGADSPLVTHVIVDPGYRWASRRRGQVLWLVLHSCECECTDAAALAVAGYLRVAAGASAHYVVGPRVVVQQVPERHVAWTQGAANAECISIEHAGRSLPGGGHAATDWAAQPELLRTSARLARDICDRWGIPWLYVGQDGVRERRPGIVTHGDITRALGVKGGHVDPIGWPWEEWLALGG